MDIQKYFPFVNYARVIKRSYGTFDLSSPKYLRTANINGFNQDMIDQAWMTMNTSDAQLPTVDLYHIMPNDVYYYPGNDTKLTVLLNYAYDDSKVINVLVTDVDYTGVAEQITINGNMVSISKSNGYETTVPDTFVYIEDARNGVTSELNTNTVPVADSWYLTEADYQDLFKGISTEYSREVKSNTTSYQDAIRNYLKSTIPTEKIPLLVGMSGVAKSALVKQLAEEYGMRLVDLRVSFMSRLDIDGLTEIIGEDIGEPLSINSPMEEFLTCTDEYIDFATRVVGIIDKKLEDTSLSEEDKAQLAKARINFAEMSKIPVLLFDEITRSDRSIRGALTTIINQRIYGKYHLKKARMVAATNAPVGYEDDDDMQDMFIGATLEDVAVLDRFNKIPVKPEDVYDSWLNWASKNLNPIVVDFVKNNPKLAYDLTPAVNYARDDDKEDNLIPPYPTYRAWENISNYLNNIQDKEINYSIIEGLLGLKAAKTFTTYLIEQGYSNKYGFNTTLAKYDTINPEYRDLVKDYVDHAGNGISSFAESGRTIIANILTDKLPDIINKHKTKFSLTTDEVGKYSDGNTDEFFAEVVNDSLSTLATDILNDKTAISKFTNAMTGFTKQEQVDPLTDFITDSLDAGLPTMIMGVSGLGKTTRVREYAESHGYDFELISLSTMDRLDISGPPAKVDIINYIGKENSGIFDKVGILDDLKTAKGESGLPNYITIKAPRFDMKERIQKAVDSGRPLVVAYDEFNRSIDTTTQSAIFQAISDNMIAGVKFPPGAVKVVMMGNLGDSTREAGNVDGALTARAVQYKKMEYDESDAKAVLAYMKSHDYAEPLLDWIGNDTEKVLEWIKSVDEGSLTTNVSSTRSLKELSNLLKESQESKQLHGTMLIPSDEGRQDFNMHSNSYDKVVATAKQMQASIKNWAALGSYEYPGGTSLEDAVKIFNQAVPILESDDIKNNYYDPTSSEGQFFNNVVTMMQNFLAIDEAVSAYRKKTFGYYVSKETAEEFTDYYNTVSGRGSGSISIEDLIDTSLIPIYVKSTMAKLDAISPKWHTIVEDIYNQFTSTYSVDDYFDVVKTCVDNDISVENSKEELKACLSINSLENIFLKLESPLTTQFSSRIKDDKYIKLLEKLGFTLDQFSNAESSRAIIPGVF